MEARIEILAEKKLVGIQLKMNMTQNKTALLWGRFAPRIKEIANRNTKDKISMQIYDPSYFAQFNPTTEFVKWAVVEVMDFNDIPEGMESFILKEGKYAVFHYKGSSQNAFETFQYIFGTWIPRSIYQLDDRPHFELLGEKYINNDPNSEEEIWIPIKEKN